MPGVRTIWQKAAELPIRKVDEVVHGAQGVELVVVILSTSLLIGGKGKKFEQCRFEGLALTRRYVVCGVIIAAREHLFAEFGEGGVVGRMGWMDDKKTTSFGCVEGGNMSESESYHT